jgi:hypothetical protein
MAKIVLLGDTHFGVSKSSDVMHNYMEKFYDFFFNYLEEHDYIEHIIQLGDLYDDRKFVYFNTLDRCRKYFFDRIPKSVELTVFCGNHDVLFKNTNRISSVNLLRTNKMKIIDTQPKTILIDGTPIDFFPWINAENLDDSVRFARESSSKYAMGHFEFAGFPMHPGTVADHGMSHKLFKKYEQVFSGHYHTVSQKDNILYTGIPYELTWSDLDDPKGFWVFDTDTGEKEYIRNPHTLFLKISYVEGMKFDFKTVKYVKIVVVDKVNQKVFDKFLDNVSINQPHDVRVIESSFSSVVSEAVDVTNVVSTHQMISSVIDNMEIDLDKIKLKNYVLQYYQEAMAIDNSI